MYILILFKIFDAFYSADKHKSIAENNSAECVKRVQIIIDRDGGIITKNK